MNKQNDITWASGVIVREPFSLSVSDSSREKVLAILSLLTQWVSQSIARRKWRELVKQISPDELDVLIRAPHFRNNDLFEAAYDCSRTLPETRIYILSHYSTFRKIEDEHIRGDYRWLAWVIEALDTIEYQWAVCSNSDPTIRAMLARSPCLTQLATTKLVQDSNDAVRLSLSERTDLDEEVSNELILDANEMVRCNAVKNSKSPTSFLEKLLLDDYPQYNTLAVSIRLLQRMDYTKRYFDFIVREFMRGVIPTDLSLLIAVSPFSSPSLRKKLLTQNTKIIKGWITDDIPF